MGTALTSSGLKTKSSFALLYIRGAEERQSRRPLSSTWTDCTPERDPLADLGRSARQRPLHGLHAPGIAAAGDAAAIRARPARARAARRGPSRPPPPRRSP